MSDVSVDMLNTDKPQTQDPALNLPRKANGADHHAAQQNPILLVDSDSCRDAAAAYLPQGWTAEVCDPSIITPQTYLAFSHAIIWGKNDEGGRTWAESVADHVGIPSHVITLSRLPAHWHLDQPLPENRTAKQLTGYLQAALRKCLTRVPPPAPQAAPAPTALAVAPSPPAVLPDITNLPFIRGGANGDGAIKPLLANAALLIEANPHRWDLRFNEFSQQVNIGSNQLEEIHVITICRWAQGHGVHTNVACTHDAITAAAHKRRFHPVKDYLEAIQWDGIPRLDMLLIDHAGSPDTPLTRAVTARWFMQAVARIYDPGCQADGMIILEGQQGLRKSSFFREMFGEKWFTDHLPDLTSKDAQIQLQGIWCVEVGELATLGRAENAKIKQFLTSPSDRYRAPYGRVASSIPRACVFAGSVNPGAGGYLKDESGARRFWPIPVTERINTEAVAQAREQIWAEAMARYRAKENFYLDTIELTVAADEETRDRFDTDPWQESIDAYLRGRTQTTRDQIFKQALNIMDTGKWTPRESARVARCMTFAGWKRVQRGSRYNRSWVYIPGPEAREAGLPEPPRDDGDGYDSEM